MQNEKLLTIIGIHMENFQEAMTNKSNRLRKFTANILVRQVRDGLPQPKVRRFVPI